MDTTATAKINRSLNMAHLLKLLLKPSAPKKKPGNPGFVPSHFQQI
jgi:hypothetical protein